MTIINIHLGTTKGPFRYHFFFLQADSVEIQTRFVKKLEPHLERFARSLDDSAPKVRLSAADIEAARQQILEKGWTEAARKEIEKTPGLLMISTEYDAFDPRRNSWAHFHFGARHWEEVPDAEMFGEALKSLAEAVRDANEDAFVTAHRLLHPVEPKGVVKFEAEPPVFAFSLDLIAGGEAFLELCRGLASRNRHGG